MEKQRAQSQIATFTTNVEELKELLNLAVTQVEQLQETITAISSFELTTSLTDA
ncbi:hypothetical protein [Lacticaseibacillus salsurivasis]|uniref:hypothetical protein n=1 Tax=Lacticaseibacillus salsurivasis TaxID=3081441 RepID=UPI0030C69EB1